MDIQDLSTQELLDIADGTNTGTDYTAAQCLTEIKLRIITDEQSPERGGIHPTRPHL